MTIILRIIAINLRGSFCIRAVSTEKSNAEDIFCVSIIFEAAVAIDHHSSIK
jgi:hypothetical protein